MYNTNIYYSPLRHVCIPFFLHPVGVNRPWQDWWMTGQMDEWPQLVNFSCLNQGSAVINNSTKPPLGIRAIFRDDDHSSQKIKYPVPIYNHNYHKKNT